MVDVWRDELDAQVLAHQRAKHEPDRRPADIAEHEPHPAVSVSATGSTRAFRTASGRTTRSRDGASTMMSAHVCTCRRVHRRARGGEGARSGGCSTWPPLPTRRSLTGLSTRSAVEPMRLRSSAGAGQRKGCCAARPGAGRTSTAHGVRRLTRSTTDPNSRRRIGPWSDFAQHDDVRLEIRRKSHDLLGRPSRDKSRRPGVHARGPRDACVPRPATRPASTRRSASQSESAALCVDIARRSPAIHVHQCRAPYRQSGRPAQGPASPPPV